MKNTFTYHKSTSSVSLQGAHTHTRILDSTCVSVGLQNESVHVCGDVAYFFLQQCLFTDPQRSERDYQFQP